MQILLIFSSHTAFSLSDNLCFSFSCLQVPVWPQSCLSCWSPAMWLRSGIARSCWTARCREMNRSWSRGVKTGCLYPPARGFGCWRMARCSSRASRNAEREATQIWANTIVRPRIAMACWSAAKPKCFWHVSAFIATQSHPWWEEQVAQSEKWVKKFITWLIIVLQVFKLKYTGHELAQGAEDVPQIVTTCCLFSVKTSHSLCYKWCFTRWTPLHHTWQP